MTVGFGFAPNPAVTLAGLKITLITADWELHPTPKDYYEIVDKKSPSEISLRVILSIRNKPQKIVYFLRNVYLSSIQTMTVGFGFAPNPAVTLAGLKIALITADWELHPTPKDFIYHFRIL